MAKSIIDKAAEKAILIFVGEAARSASKTIVSHMKEAAKKIEDAKKSKKSDKTSIEQETIE